jgi:segregation and condensation protein B
VNVDSVLQTLVERGLVAEVGRDSGPGRAPLFGTTPLFLEKIGLGSVADLPPLASFAPDPQTAADIERALTSRQDVDDAGESEAQPEE